MAAKGEDEVSRQVKAQHRSVGFFSETELVQIDPGNESHGQNEDSELNETVGNLNQLLVTMHFNTALEVLQIEASIRWLTTTFHLQGLLLAGILVNEARLGRNGYFEIAPKELRYSFFI